MSKEQLKKWIKILAFAVLAFVAGCIIYQIFDAYGFVMNNFIKPFFLIIPLILILVAGILYLIYMFVEKGEPLRIIGNIFVGVLVVYIFVFGSNITRAEYNNRDRYKDLDNLETKIVNNIFEDESVKKEDDYRNSYHWSAFKTMIYESEYNGYDIESNESTVCSTDSYCVDNYSLGYNKIIISLEKKLNVLKDIRDDIILIDDEKTGNFNDMKYKWSYAEIRDVDHNRYYTRLAILVMSDNSAYLVNIRISNDELIEVDMEQQTQKLIDEIISNKIFIK